MPCNSVTISPSDRALDLFISLFIYLLRINHTDDQSRELNIYTSLKKEKEKEKKKEV